jgi:hypothetical protein
MRRPALLQRIFFSCLCLCLPGCVSIGKITENKVREPLKAVIFLSEDTATVDAAYGDIIYNNLEHRLQEEGFVLVPKDTLAANYDYREPRSGDGSAESLLPIAAELGAQTAVVGFYSIREGRLVIALKVYDVRTRKVVASALDYSMEGLAGYNVAETIADGLSSQLQSYLAGYDPQEPVDYNAVESITFRSSDSLFNRIFFHTTDEGMEASYGAEFPSAVMKNGELRFPYFPFPAGTTITITKTKEGYYPGTEKVTLKEGINEIKLRHMDKIYHHEVSAYWFPQYLNYRHIPSGLGLGAGYRYYFVPDYVFIGTDMKYYVRDKEGPDLVKDPFLYPYPYNTNFNVLNFISHLQHENVPCFDISFNAGTYLFSSYKTFVRFGLSLGGGMLMMSGPGDNHLDVYADGGVFMDFNIRPWSLFVQGDYRIALAWGDAKYYQFMSWIDEDELLPVTIGVRKKW